MKTVLLMHLVVFASGDVERLIARISNLTATMPSKETTSCQPVLRTSPWPQFVVNQLNRTVTDRAPLPKTSCPPEKSECLQALTVILIVDRKSAERNEEVKIILSDLEEYREIVVRIVLIQLDSNEFQGNEVIKVVNASSPLRVSAFKSLAEIALGPSILIIDARIDILVEKKKSVFVHHSEQPSGIPVLLDRGLRTHLNHPYRVCLYELPIRSNFFTVAFVSNLSFQDYACMATTWSLFRVNELALYISQTSGEPIVTSFDDHLTSKKTSMVHAVWASDSAETIGLLASIASALEVSQDPSRFVIHVITMNNESLLRTALECLLQKTPRRPKALHVYSYQPFSSYQQASSSILVNQSTTSRNLTSPANFARFNLDHILSSKIDRALWIDADTIIRLDLAFLLEEFEYQQRRSNLSLAVGVPLRSTMTVATQCCRHTKIEDTMTKEFLLLESLDLKSNCGFNAGVMVYDLKLWRSTGLAALVNAWNDFGHMIPFFKGQTQGPLLLATRRGNFATLDPTWNMLTHSLRDVSMNEMQQACSLAYHNKSAALQQTLEIASTARIIHFAGNHKPWHVTSPESRRNHFFWRYYGNLAQRCLPSTDDNSTTTKKSIGKEK